MLKVLDIIDNANFTQTEIDGRWVPARPEPYYNWWVRLKDAWEVFRYRADAVKWPEHDEGQLVQKICEILPQTVNALRREEVPGLPDTPVEAYRFGKRRVIEAHSTVECWSELLTDSPEYVESVLNAIDTARKQQEA